jgi:hypothetical protein
MRFGWGSPGVALEACPLAGVELRQALAEFNDSSSLSEKSDFPNKDNLDVKYGHDQKIQNR